MPHHLTVKKTEFELMDPFFLLFIVLVVWVLTNGCNSRVFRKAISIVKTLVGFRSQALEAAAIFTQKGLKIATCRLLYGGEFNMYHLSKICKIAHALERS